MAKWLEAALDYIPSWLEFQLRESRQPGCAIAVAYRGRVVLDRAFGFADCSTGELLTPRHRFRAASHSKSFTAAGIMKLRESVALSLDDSIGKHVAGLHPRIASARIRQVLSHGSGISRDGDDCDYYYGRRPFPTANELMLALKSPPLIKPNRRFKYSNLGFGLLGLVIEAVTGEPYVRWIKREIVDAMGLRETTPDMLMPRGAPLAKGHTDEMLLGKRAAVPSDYVIGALASAVGFVSTASDLATFYARLSPRAKSSVISVRSRGEITRAKWRNLHSSANISYGLGALSGTVDGWNWFGHSGGLEGYLSRTKMLPAHDLTVCVLANSADAAVEKWINGAIHILRTFHERGAPPPRLKDWNGRWWGLWGAVDLLPVGTAVLAANPRFENPFLDASELRIIDRDNARIAVSTGFMFYGESVRRKRNRDGRITELWLAGDKFVPGDVRAAEIARRSDLDRTIVPKS